MMINNMIVFSIMIVNNSYRFMKGIITWTLEIRVKEARSKRNSWSKVVSKVNSKIQIHATRQPLHPRRRRSISLASTFGICKVPHLIGLYMRHILKMSPTVWAGASSSTFQMSALCIL